ncbi:MAG: DUF4249 domain-containing protein [Imperialibacter sp.]|uniref:DUF4249 domain-containing protein n=1 Tax=Imperialibacter sp. TaxID=2038411 RepID=UPI0032EBC6BE
MSNSAYIYSVLTLALVALQGCIDPYDYPFEEKTNYLVVEGAITTDEGPYVITLTSTRNIKNEENAFKLRMQNAMVAIATSNNQTVRLAENDTSGKYYTPLDFRGVVGEKYQLKITLEDGRDYLSDSVELVALPEIDSIGIRYGSERYVSELNSSLERTGFFIDAYVRDPKESANYYRANWDYTYKIFTHPERSIPPSDCCSDCWVEHEAPGFTILDDELNNGDNNAQYPIFFLPVTGKMFYDKIYVEAKLQALSRDAYFFWKTVYNAAYSQGGIFDPTPITLASNVKNVNDSSELVLGNFYAGEVRTITRFIFPNEFPERKDYDTGQIGSCLLLPNTTIVEPEYWNE